MMVSPTAHTLMPKETFNSGRFDVQLDYFDNVDEFGYKMKISEETIGNDGDVVSEVTSDKYGENSKVNNINKECVVKK